MRFIIAIVAVALPLIAAAHHSRSEYEFDVLTELAGEVVSVSWRNPHIEFRLRDSQSGEEWHVEGNSAIAMNAMNVHADSLLPGMSVRVAGGASVRRPNRMEMTNILLPTGFELVTRTIVPARWAEPDRIITEGQLYAPTGRLPDDGRGIFRIWSWEPVEEFWMIRPADTYPLTAAARAAAADWDEDDPEDNLILQCIDPGMPSVMGNPHPMEFVDLGDVIEVRNEEFDSVRRIHLDSAVDPASIAPSLNGYSVGHWEDDTLVVTTTRLSAPYFNRLGVPLSREAKIEERFSVDPAEGRLNYVLTVTDPVNLTEPFNYELAWNWNEDAYLQRYDCKVNE